MYYICATHCDSWIDDNTCVCFVYNTPCNVLVCIEITKLGCWHAAAVPELGLYMYRNCNGIQPEPKCHRVSLLDQHHETKAIPLSKELLHKALQSL